MTKKLLTILREYIVYIGEYIKASQQNMTKILINKRKISP